MRPPGVPLVVSAGPGPADGDGQWSSGSTRHGRAITRLPLPAYLT